MTRLPYGRAAAAAATAYFDPLLAAQAGYVVVLQDVRGRGDSTGEFVPSVNENKDGAETVEWVANLPYCNGRVGMCGRSYFAETQLRAAAEKPQGLDALALGVCAGGNANNGALFRGGALELGSRLGWAHYSIGAMDQASRIDTEQPWLAFDELVISGGWPTTTPIDSPENKLSQLDVSLVKEGIEQGPGGQVSRDWNNTYTEPLDLPTLHIGGWFDIFLLNTLDQYRAQRQATEGAHDTRLMIGPWVHIHQTALYPEISFGAQATGMNVGGRGSLHQLHMNWFDHTLRDGEALDSELRVQLFVMGTNRWLRSSELPEPTGSKELFLAEHGTLSFEPVETSTSVFISDPENPVPTVGGATMLPAHYLPGPRTYNQVEQRDDVAVFTSDPLEEDLTVFGEVTAHITVEVDAPDADLVVRLCAVDEDGKSVEVSDGITRLSQRNNLAAQGRFIGDGEPCSYEAGSRVSVPVMLNPTLWTIKKGQRLRVHVTGSSFPRWDANPQNGERMYMTNQSAQKAEIRVIQGGEAGSYLLFGTLDLAQFSLS